MASQTFTLAELVTILDQAAKDKLSEKFNGQSYPSIEEARNAAKSMIIVTGEDWRAFTNGKEHWIARIVN